MKIHFLTPVLFLLFTLQVTAQKLEVRGAILDSLSQPLPSATVVLLSAQDSVLKHFTMANNQGAFSIKGVQAASYILQITYLGYNPYFQAFETPEGAKSFDLGQIQLSSQAALLKEIVVRAEHNPVTLNHDTIVYNAAAFQTRPNAVVEDLLKKLPGVEVESDGSIKAHGKGVQNVLVDGKEFFGKDPKIATKNLPADAVDKVQVYDKKSDMAEFTGIDDGREEKTINLALKEDKKKGVFGQIRGGAGTEERYEGKININRFSPTRQFSVLGMANNVNEAGFSFQDYINFSGGMGSFMGAGGRMQLQIGGDNGSGIPLNLMGGNQGILTTYAGGVNYNNDFSDKTELQASYFFNQTDQELDRESSRENFFGDQIYTSNQDDLQNNLNRNHRINLTLDHKIDTLNSLKMVGRFGFSDNDLNTTQENLLFDINDELSTEGNRDYSSQGNGLNYSTNLLYRRRFNKKGRTFSLGLNANRNSNEGEGFLYALNNYYTNSINRIDTLQQDNLQEGDRQNLGADLSFTESVGKRQFIQLNYNYLKNVNETRREVYDIPFDQGGSPLLNLLLSNHYESDYTYHRPGITYRYTGKKANIAIGLDYQQSYLHGDLLMQEVTIDRKFSNILPNFRWNYELNQNRNLTMNYRTNMREPSITELAPIVDNTDPLNIYQGNPDLRPAYDHNVQLHYFSFNAAEMINFMAFMQLRYTQNRITNAQSIDENLVRTIQPINVDSDYSLRTDFSFSSPIRFMKSRINLSGDTEFGRGINFLNARENQTDRLSLGGKVQLENRFKEVVDISGGVRLSYNQLRYSLDDNFDQDYLNQIYFMEFGLKLPKGLYFTTDLNHNIYNGIDEGLDQEITMWDASLAKTIFKNERGEIKISAKDILNQNQGITRRPQLNYIEEESIRNIGRYFLLSFSYQLSAMGTPGPSIEVIKD